MKAVILAGGKGTRLAPYSTILPKPLLPIDGVPILDVIIRQLIRYGFKDVTLAVGHLAELVMAYCGDGTKYNIRLTYSREERPLGTAGPLATIPGLNEPFLVTNGDVLTTMDFADMWRFHKQQGAIATLAVTKRDVKIELGVVRSQDGVWVDEYIEKPTLNYSVSAGVYVFEPAVLTYIPRGLPLDLPDLILKLGRDNQRVACYLHDGYWLHISREDDYKTAIQEFVSHRDEFLNQ
jgi:NDP-sugar pyrophosphorylase family protein